MEKYLNQLVGALEKAFSIHMKFGDDTPKDVHFRGIVSFVTDTQTDGQTKIMPPIYLCGGIKKVTDKILMKYQLFIAQDC